MKMTSLSLASLICLLALLPWGLHAQNPNEIPRLSGIVNMPGQKAAVFEFGSDCCNSPRQLVLSEGESFWSVKVLEVLPEQRAVRILVNETNTPVTLAFPVSSNAPAGLNTIELINCSLYSLLELFAKCNDRTCLFSPLLAPGEFSLTGSVTNEAGLAELLTRKLAERDIVTVPDGERFLAVVPKSQLPSLKPHAPKATPRPSPQPTDGSSESNAKELLGDGAIMFHGADLSQVFDVYAMMLGGSIDRNAPRPKAIQPFIFLYGNKLNHEEAMYALDTWLKWQGIKMVRGDDGVVRIAPATKD